MRIFFGWGGGDAFLRELRDYPYDSKYEPAPKDIANQKKDHVPALLIGDKARRSHLRCT